MIADNNGNRWLTHPDAKGVTPPMTGFVGEYRAHALQVTGGLKLPAVRYKGQVIPARGL